MENSIEKCNKILELWKLQEYFTPLSYPQLIYKFEKDGKEYPLDYIFDKKSTDDLIPKENYKNYNEMFKSNNFSYDYINIYYGCYKVNSFLLKMAEVLNLDENQLNEINEISGDFYIYIPYNLI